MTDVAPLPAPKTMLAPGFGFLAHLARDTDGVRAARAKMAPQLADALRRERDFQPGAMALTQQCASMSARPVRPADMWDLDELLLAL